MRFVTRQTGYIQASWKTLLLFLHKKTKKVVANAILEERQSDVNNHTPTLSPTISSSVETLW